MTLNPPLPIGASCMLRRIAAQVFRILPCPTAAGDAKKKKPAAGKAACDVVARNE